MFLLLMLVKILQKRRSLLSNSNLTEKFPILFQPDVTDIKILKYYCTCHFNVLK